MGTEVTVRATTGMEVKKNLGDDKYATANDGCWIGRRLVAVGRVWLRSGDNKSRTSDIGCCSGDDG